MVFIVAETDNKEFCDLGAGVLPHRVPAKKEMQYQARQDNVLFCLYWVDYVLIKDSRVNQR